MAFIILRHQVINEQDSTQQIPVAGTTLEIGRGSGNALLLDDLRIGLRHAIIRYVDGRYVIQDLESGGNTYVNHRPIRMQPLAHGDEVNIGNYTLRLRLPSPAEPLQIEVTGGETETEAEQGTATSYLARYRLRDSAFTKKRLSWWGVGLALAGTLLILLYPKIPIGGKVWHTTDILSPGAVTPPHRFIEQQCGICHTTAWGAPTTAACTQCHTGLTHDANQTFTPECVTCHREHRGDSRALTTIRDHLCVQCHADLRVLEGKTPQYATHVNTFNTDHPDFAVLVKEPPGSQGTRVRLNAKPAPVDTSAIKLNHEIHLSDRIKKVTSKTLTCTNCHKMDAQGVTILPIDYTEHCSQCHPLEFDNRFPGQVVGHGVQPEVIQEFLKNNFFTPRCLELAGMPQARPPASPSAAVVRPGGGPATSSSTPSPPVSLQASVMQCRDDGVREAQKRLYTGGKQSVCGLCHVLQDPASANQLPTVVRPAIPLRWFPHSRFEHQTHVRATAARATEEKKNPCEYCHRPDLPAFKSNQTTDVLMPGIASCQTCHTSSSGGASTQCVTCHPYHERKASKP